MKLNIHPSWQAVLAQELEQAYFYRLMQFLSQEYRDHRCFPAPDQLFEAFNECPFDKVKVVIIGQDPYHGHGQANGMCFSVEDGVKFPPSLANIFKELATDLDQAIPISGNLRSWAQQGVLLLNATLSVREGQAGSHQKKGWEQFTDKVIEQISRRRQGVIFLLWGGFAQKKGKSIDTSKHHILTSGHPSPLSANRGYWFGNRHFSKTNELLVAMGASPIVW
ncbi:MAG: uracil-DNA glycosylase [Cytophagaceae bacterium]|nr:uracil-DNA glycosylase [Cytophagaceae bacterium]